MTGIRARIVLLSGLAVALAVVAAAVGSYLAVRSDLLGQIDDSLEGQASVISSIARDRDLRRPLPGRDLPAPPEAAPPRTDGGVRIQLVSPSGRVSHPPRFAGNLPVSAADRELAATGSGRSSRDVVVDGETYRVLITGVGDDGAVMLARSLEGVDMVLANLRLTLALLAVGGITLAAALALLVGGRVVRPIRELTAAAEHISETSDLERRIEAERSDEVGRLASRFNAMLDTIAESHGALERSVSSQRQLVADASHELRTPVAAIRTDIDALLAHPGLPVAERTKILASADARIEELTDLVLDVIELARDEQAPTDGIDQVRLDAIAAESIARLQDLAPERRVRVSTEPTVVDGRTDRIYRAINNLLDNAHKYSPIEEPIEITVARGSVSVSDRGPGIPDEDLPRLFDRFWRGASSRNQPGSGLGLAIVKQVADASGGAVSVTNTSAGASFRLVLPVSDERDQRGIWNGISTVAPSPHTATKTGEAPMRR